MKTKRAPGSIGENTELSIDSRIANEFQMPLGVIISAGELLESYFERLTPDRRRLALEDILSAARQMNSRLDLLTAFENEANPESAGSRTSRKNKRKRQQDPEAFCEANYPSL